MYLTAAMTGMRQGELLALRWRDVDWTARRVRVRRNFVRGEFGTPKSKRSSRSVPLADRLAGELDLLHSGDAAGAATTTSSSPTRTRASRSTARKLLKRFKAALRRAGVREVRFHDLRHTFGTRMAAQGVPMRTLQEMDGPPRLQDDADLRRLHAERARGGPRRPRVRRATVHCSVHSERNLRSSKMR